MANFTNIDSDVHVAGYLSSNTMGIPDGTVDNAAVSGSAAIAATKTRHRLIQIYSQELSETAVADERVIHVAKVAGNVEGIEVGSATVCTVDAAITVDLRKHTGGTDVSILSATVVLDSGNAIYIPEAGAIDTAAYVAEDVFELRITVAAGGGVLGTGLFAAVSFDEQGV